MHAFYLEKIPAAGEIAALDRAESHHALRVLRIRNGELIRLQDGNGTVATAIVKQDDLGGKELRCRVDERVSVQKPATEFRLMIAPPRAKLTGQIVRSATELGVMRITPVLCRYSVSKPKKIDHWRDEAVAALKQSGNLFLPTFDEPLSFDEAVADSGSKGFFGAIPGSGFIQNDVQIKAGEMQLWIGPEGGFSQEETVALLENGHRPVIVGNWILRVETAVPALLGLLLGKADDDLLCYKSS